MPTVALVWTRSVLLSVCLLSQNVFPNFMAVFSFACTRMADHLGIPLGPGFDSRSLHCCQQSKKVRGCSSETLTLEGNHLNLVSMSLLLRGTGRPSILGTC